MTPRSILLLVILAIFSLNLFNLWQKIREGEKRLVDVRNEVNQKIKSKEDLEKEIAQKQSLDYLEKQARDQLNLVKRGERIVILPPKEPEAGVSRPVDKLGNQGLGPAEVPGNSEPNWRRWWKLIFQ